MSVIARDDDADGRFIACFFDFFFHESFLVDRFISIWSLFIFFHRILRARYDYIDQITDPDERIERKMKMFRSMFFYFFDLFLDSILPCIVHRT